MTENYVKALAVNNTRIDGRALDSIRDIEIKTDIIERSEGSAFVRLGNTQVIAGVKFSMSEPFADTPNEGVLIVNAEFSPMASAAFEAGPPDVNAIEVARVVDRAIRESHCIDFEKLCIIPNEKVWHVNVDIEVVDHDGNLIDASCIAALSALLTAKIPKYENEKAINEPNGPMPITDRPVHVTIAKIKDKLFVDPSLEEEEAMEAKISIATTSEGKLCAIQKSGASYFTLDEIEKAVDMAIEVGRKIREKLPPLP